MKRLRTRTTLGEKEKAKAKMMFRLRGMFKVVVLFTGFVFCLKMFLFVVRPLAAVFCVSRLVVCGFDSLTGGLFETLKFACCDQQQR